MPLVELPPPRRPLLVALSILAGLAVPCTGAWSQAGPEIESLVAPGAAPAPTGARNRGVSPPRPGKLKALDVLPGSLVHLDDPIFDPARARYSIDDDDLVIELENGGTLVLGGFLARSPRSARLAVGKLPPVSAGTILARGAEQALAGGTATASEAGHGDPSNGTGRARPRP